MKCLIIKFIYLRFYRNQFRWSFLKNIIVCARFRSGVGAMDIKEIPHDTLVTLLKKKEKEIKLLQGNKTRAEEGFTKIRAFNKILYADRLTFIRFYQLYCPDAQAIFESAAAQEQSVDFDVLVSKAKASEASSKALSSAPSDRELLQGLVHLVFPNDPDVQSLFADGAKAPDFEVFRNRWMAHEELQSQSLASVSAAAQGGMLVVEQKLRDAEADRRMLENKVEDLREQLQQSNREKAQMLNQRLRATKEEGDNAPLDSGFNMNKVLQRSPSDSISADDPQLVACKREIEELQASMAALRSELVAAREVSTRASETHAQELEQERSRVVSLSGELAAHKERTRALLEQKDSAMEKLVHKIAKLQTERDASSFIEEMAAKQATRDLDISRVQLQMEQMNMTPGPPSTNHRASLSSVPTGDVHDDAYLRNILLSYVRYLKDGDPKANTLVPVLSTRLSMSPPETLQLELDAGWLGFVTEWIR